MNSETSTTTAESDVTLEDPAPALTADPTPEPETPAEQVEEEPAALPEVEATVGRDQATGKYLVSITTRHPDPTVVAVNGHHVWEGNG
jgi:hypothetical protein